MWYSSFVPKDLGMIVSKHLGIQDQAELHLGKIDGKIDVRALDKLTIPDRQYL